ncbi:hypothetical protein AA637_09845 [Cyanobacterium sp. HL-69]|uniref:hypothetical protein n=1 Tax=Cyanobacterium sp. HL-69 TaxID=2054282 RepID=UPI000CA2CD28|nr:hypothetical protein AA637_09845 [Cyanobacterium sp. HL-69]
MSSNQESSTRYKSRLLNFFNRQYLKINSSLGISVRQFTQTVNTGIATILYPLYVLLKNTKKIGNIFTGTSENISKKQLNKTSEQVSSDYILEQVSEQIIDIPEIPKLKRKSVKGLASLIDNHNIVIAKPKNQIKIVFPPRHQEEIKTIIDTVITEYKTEKGLLTTENSNDKKQLKPSFDLINPFKLFSRNRKISQDLEQLKKSDLISTQPPEETSLNNQNIEPDSNKVILFIDKLFFKIEKGALTVLKKEESIVKSQENNSQSLDNVNKQEKAYFVALIEAAINYFFTSKDIDNKTIENDKCDNYTLKEKHHLSKTNKEITQQIQGIVTQSQEILPVIQAKTEKLMVKGLNQASVVKSKFDSVINHDDNPLNIQALIWAAIDYFFNIKLDKDKPLTFSQSTKELFLIDGQVSDPWLSWEDLYGEKNPLQFQDNQDKNIDHKSVVHTPLKKDLSVSKNKVDTQKDLIAKVTSESKTITLVDEKKFIDVQKHPSEGEIEAKVITMGYEKHFLEIILEKLDVLILTMENFILNIVNFFKSLIQRF